MSPLNHVEFQKKLKSQSQENLWKEGKTRPYSYDPSSHGQESYKIISQLRGIAVDNKNKIQYNST